MGYVFLATSGNKICLSFMVLALVSYINLGLSLVVQTDGAVEKKKVTV